MSRVAVLVDAGYLFAQGSTNLTGSKKPRSKLSLKPKAVISELISIAKSKAPDCSLLRVYWYDGVQGYNGPTAEQTSLAILDNTKLRLGFINSHGQQKGVDSLIVIDLIDLARNNAVSDVVLLSGDEDVRVGVQVAQNYGVRVHLLGIKPSRGSQSRQLLHEVDSTTVWDKEIIGKFLSFENLEKDLSPEAAAIIASSDSNSMQKIDAVVAIYAGEILGDKRSNLKTYWQENPDVPREYDGPLLGKCRDALERDLDFKEKKRARSQFKRKLN